MSKRNGQHIKTQTVEVKAADFQVNVQYPTVRVNTTQNKTQELTVCYVNGQAIVKRRYHLQDHPCPACYHSHGGTGLVRSTQGRVQYVRCRQCGHNWTNPIPAEVCMNEKPDPQWSKVAERMDAVELAWPALQPEQKQAVAGALLDTLSRFTS